jgi:FeS assembly SUF system protein
MLRDRLVQALKTVYDPEIPVNIYDLGLIYDLDVAETGEVHVRMTLTAPGCPVAGSLVKEVHDRVRETVGVRRVRTELVWDPPWTQDCLSFEARLELGLD